MATKFQQEEDFDESGDDQELEQQSQADDESDPEPSEEQARRLGWKPKDEFKGDASQWRDWQDFLNEDLSNAPQLKATVKLLKRRLDQTDRRYKKLESTLDEAKDYFSKAEQRAYDRAVSDIKAKQRAAVALADEDAYEAADEELKQLEKDAKAGKPAAKPEADPEMQRVYRKWKRDNDWYGVDEAMTVVADKIADKLIATGFDGRNDPEEFTEFMGEITARVKKEFPHKFELPKKRSAVEGVGETRATRGQKTFDHLPAEAKAQCDRFVAQGLIKDRAQYVKDFDWS